MIPSHHIYCLGETGVARLACDLDRRQAALKRFGASGTGRYQAREIAKSIREMLKSVRVKVPFRTASHALEDHLKEELVKLADAVRTIPAARIDIEAHTDVRGSRRFNRKLAFERAHAVRQVFLRRGVPLGRITARALGGEGAVYPRGDRGGYAFDRQAIIRIEVEETDT